MLLININHFVQCLLPRRQDAAQEFVQNLLKTFFESLAELSEPNEDEDCQRDSSKLIGLALDQNKENMFQPVDDNLLTKNDADFLLANPFSTADSEDISEDEIEELFEKSKSEINKENADTSLPVHVATLQNSQHSFSALDDEIFSFAVSSIL